MQKNPDQKASSKQDEADDLRTSLGEVVRRVDLDRAAGTPSRFVCNDPSVAGYEGVELAKAALAGDQAALDEFHALAGLALPGVTEYSEGDAVRLVMREIDKEIKGLEIQNDPVGQHGDEARAVFQATNEGKNNSTCIDAAELVTWIVSPEGQAALACRGITVPILAPGDSIPEQAEPEQWAEDYAGEKLGGDASRTARDVVRDAFLAGYLVGMLKFSNAFPSDPEASAKSKDAARSTKSGAQEAEGSLTK